MLAIIEDQKLVLVAQRVNETFQRIDRLAFDAERAADGQDDKLSILDRSQVNEAHGLRLGVTDVSCGCDSDAGLADAGRADDRQQPGLAQRLDNSRQRIGASDQRL
ncbi:hypothetical protein [Rhizobium tropici]|uniref:hypothetical protein n=1 Tax=Rhizobium tropici TaxID=398 RepID=UPI001FE0D8C3|nr:hypothetical protein [Rhizobium tropici]